MPDQCLSIFIGDDTGHGFHTSVIMSLIYGYIHRSTLGECSPNEIATGVDRFLSTFAQRTWKLGHYFSATLFFAIIDPRTLEMNSVNGGHTPPPIKQKGALKILYTSDPPLGFFEKPEIELCNFQLNPGDRL